MSREPHRDALHAICLRCGGPKGALGEVCPSCGHRPEGEGLHVAWLLSDQHLDQVGLALASQRIRDGELVQPSAQLLQTARRALRADLATDPGLTAGDWAKVTLGVALLSPLLGYALWFGWRERRPRAARQALWLAIPMSAVDFVAVVGLLRWG
ncbi:MAG: hypothetical protein JXX28_12550 [Deltaproteobacteria bacterium]|nr:hypothetical protein [Deltaproteobacteria bacterium]